MTTFIIIGIIAFIGIIGAISFARAILQVMREQFDELMPQRMVDMSGFVEIPTKK